EDWMGSNHLVVPATILVEGVHNKLFYSAEELKNSAHLWNGIPIPIYHPKDENGIPTSANTPEITSQCAGRFWNTTFDPKVKGLKGEFWLDTKKFGGDILDKILNGQMEISTGLWSDEEAGEGDWNGEKYIASLSNYRPDHVAILPNEIGACSWEDGCGIRVNSSDENPYRKEEQNIVKNELNLLKKGDKFKVILMAVNGEEGTLKTLLKTLGKGLGLKVQELSHDDIRQQLNEQIRAKFKTPTNQYPDVWVRDVWDDHLVYESGSKKYDQSYSLAADEVEITGDPVEVKLKSSYVPVVSKTSGSGVTRANEEDEGTGDDDILNNEDVDDNKEDPNKSKTKKEEVVIMARKETVNKLIENKKFSEEDRVWLDALEDEQFDKVAKLAGLEDDPDADDPDADADEDVDADDLDTNADKDKEKDAPAKKAATPEEFLANSEMPSEVRDVLTSGLKMQKAKKAGYVKRILGREGNTFTQNQLAAKNIDELESLVALIGDEVDFSGGPGGPGPKEPNLNEKQEDGSGVPKPLRPEFKDGKPIIP
ncbi:MAG: DUF2213 domain-containing protein, partial [Gammaproteobacteria bacterium]|nr:DUF2213 domain-containing protein [Gammaproteobacteria bacterium]